MPTFVAIPTNPGRALRASCCEIGCSRPTTARRNEGLIEELPSSLGFEPRGMPTQVIGNESGNEVVAVVITFLATEVEGDACLRTSSFQQFRTKLFYQERIGIADVDQKIGKSGAVLDQRNRIVLAPCALVVAEIASQRLDTPGDLRGCGDRRKGAGGAVTTGVREGDR